MPAHISLKRVYEQPSVKDGVRVLVDRLWPRGLTKEKAEINKWLRDLAPSNQLRRWFHARPTQWPAFRKKYLQELSATAAGAALQELYRLAYSAKHVTLVYASKNLEHNNAVVLKELLEGMRKPPTGTGPAGAAANAERARVRKHF